MTFPAALRRAALALLLPAALLAEAAEPIAVDIDARSGRVRQIHFAPAPLAAASFAATEDILVRRSDALLERHRAALFGTHRPTLERTQVRRSLSGSQIFHRQLHGGVEVEGAAVTVRLNRAGEALSIDSTAQLDLTLAEFSPEFSLARAMQIARAEAGPTDRIPPRGKLVVLPLDGGRLAWRIELSLWAPFVDWLVYVDAKSGESIERHDRMLHEKPVPEGFSLPVQPMQPRPQLRKFTGAATGSGFVLPRNPLDGFPERYHLRDGAPEIEGFREALTLERLDGSGYLRGSYADVDNNDVPRANEPSLEFHYSALETNGHFHEVNTYWHVDVFQNYITNTLGISGANDDMQALRVHQGEDDNSSYSPGTDSIRFGDGGVDDSADGEIVLHEYGHAIHDAISGLSFNFENSALSEGFGDYCAATFSGNALVGEWDATSYNPGPPPFLRRTDLPLRYPDNVTGSIHETGQIIASAWWDLRAALGAELADRLILESFFLFPNQGGFREFATATQQADLALYGGAHFAQIFAAYDSHGIPMSELLAATHEPLPDDPDVFGPFRIEAVVVSSRALAAASPVQLFHRFAGESVWNAEPMLDEGDNLWSVEIDGPGEQRHVEYYIRVENDQGAQAFSPNGAPAQFHSFEAGASTLPAIDHVALRDTPLDLWPPRVVARAYHAGGIESVLVRWSVEGQVQTPIELLPAGSDEFAARFPALEVAPGDSIRYEIAVRAKTGGDEGVDGPHAFAVLSPARLVLQQNRPNPFNPTTSIAFALPAPSPIELTIFDLAGRRVRRLAFGPFDAGLHVRDWDGRDDAGRPVSSGVYIYRLKTSHDTRAKRMTLLQ
jgi:hypothetical protein